MRITISLPRPMGDPDGTVEACARVAHVAEQSGAHAVSVTDHPFPSLPAGTPGHQAHDPFALLAFLAAGTDAVRLQVSLLVAGYRNPFLAARAVATLDQVSGGRAMVTLGAGYQRAEFAALGSPYDERGRRLREAAPAMRAAWSGTPVHASGHGWVAEGNVLAPGCVQSPHPPLWRGGNSPAALRHVAEDLDGWAPLEVGDQFAARVRTTGLGLRTIAGATARLHELWRSAGRSGTPDVSLVRTRPDWLADPVRVRDETAELAESGVTWLEVTPAGETVAEQERSIEDTLAVIDGAGQLASR